MDAEPRSLALRIGAISAIGVWVVGAGMPVAEAHTRDYVLNQAYYTTKRGECEVELHNDMNFPEADNDGSYTSTHQVELEYGVTDHLQLAYYEVYAWNRTDDWQRDAFKIETKYRFAEAGQWPVDLTLYIEYENPNGTRASHSDTLENKLSVSKNMGRWNVTANFIFETALNNGDPWEYEYTAGISHELTPRTQLALEVKQGLGDSEDFHFDSTEPLYLMPTLATTLTPHVRLLAGPAFGLTRASDDLQLRSIVEIEF